MEYTIVLAKPGALVLVLILYNTYMYILVPSIFLYIILLLYLMLLFRFVCSFTTPVRVIFLYHIWCINKPSYPILSYVDLSIDSRTNANMRSRTIFTYTFYTAAHT